MGPTNESREDMGLFYTSFEDLQKDKNTLFSYFRIFIASFDVWEWRIENFVPGIPHSIYILICQNLSNSTGLASTRAIRTSVSIRVSSIFQTNKSCNQTATAMAREQLAGWFKTE